MPRKRQFGDLSKRSQNKIAADATRYGLTRRQARERYNRGTYNPLARDPDKQIPQHAPYYPTEIGRELKDRALANFDRVFGDEFSYQSGRFTVLDAIEHHASDRALRRMAYASEDELRHWARYQRKYSYKGKHGLRQDTPEWLSSLGWDQDGAWHNVFWYH